MHTRRLYVDYSTATAVQLCTPTRDRVGGGGAHPPLGLTGLGRHKGPATDDDLDGGLASDDY